MVTPSGLGCVDEGPAGKGNQGAGEPSDGPPPFTESSPNPLPGTEPLVKMSYTELHFHVLPGVDDGPDSMLESIELARAAAAEGTRTITATPHIMRHLVSDPGTLPERVTEVNEALQAAGVPVAVLCGGELSHPMVSRLSHQDLDVIAHGPAGRRWLLLEAPLEGLDHSFSEAAAELRGQGFGVLIAHPERAVAAVPDGWPIIQAEIEAGCGVQVNAWSLDGYYGDLARDTAIRAIRTAPVAVLASDAHSLERPPSLRLGLEHLRSIGISRPEWFVETVPRALLEQGMPITTSAVAA